MAGIDVKDSLERFAAEGTRGAAAPPAAAIRRRRRNRRLRLAAGAVALLAAIAVATPVAWDALGPDGPFGARPVAPATEDGGAPAPGQPAPDARPGTADPDAPVSKDGTGQGAGQGGQPSGGGTSGSSGSSGQAGAGAEAAAVAAWFLRSEFGMTEPVARARRTTATSALVDVHPRAAGEGGRETGGPVTTVSLRRDGGGWVVTGASTADIKVTSPAAGARVGSPVTLRGSALAFEGTVQVRVLANRTGKDPVLGEGFVTGGGDVLRPFTGRVGYRGAGGAGWVAFFTVSEADGQVLSLTLVPVRLG